MAVVVTVAKGYDLGYIWKNQAQASAERTTGGYYINAAQAGEPPGLWWGPGAQALGFTFGQVVERKPYDTVYQQRDPRTGDKLGRARGRYTTFVDHLTRLKAAEPHATAERVIELEREAAQATRQPAAYTDVTVSFSKSISMLRASIRENARQAQMAGDHRALANWSGREEKFQQILHRANRAALEYLQAWAGVTRTGYHGVRVDGHEPGRFEEAGLIVTSWLQGTSRDGDPQDHIHSQIARIARTTRDGKWRALDTASLRAVLGALQAIAATAVEGELTREFGVAWIPRADGRGNEIRRITQAQMDAYSTRTVQVHEKERELAQEWQRRHGRAPTSRELLYIANDDADKRVRRYVRGKTKQEVKDKLKDLHDEIKAGIHTPATYTVKQCVMDWLDSLELDPHTMATYRGQAEKWIYPKIGAKKLADFKATDADRFLRDVAKVLSKPSLVKIKSTLVRSIRRAQKYDLIGKNVAELVDLPQGQPGHSSRAMTEEQASKVLQAASGQPTGCIKVVKISQGKYAATHATTETGELACGTWTRLGAPMTEIGADLAMTTCRFCREQLGLDEDMTTARRLEALFVLSITLGLRPGELRKLAWDHVDLDNAVIHVWRSASRTGDVKTPKSKRSLVLPKRAVTALQAHKKRQAAERLAAGPAWQDNNLVFCHEDGRMYTGDALNWRFGKMTKRAGVGHWRAHEGRHAAVSIMSSNGVPLQEISDTVGHKSIHVTETVYRHVIVPTIRGGATVMDAVFGDADNPDGEDGQRSTTTAP